MADPKVKILIDVLKSGTGDTKARKGMDSVAKSTKTADKNVGKFESSLKSASTKGNRYLKKISQNVTDLKTRLVRLKDKGDSAFKFLKSGAELALRPIELLGGAIATAYGALATYSGFALDAAGDLEMYQAQLEAVMQTADDAKKAFEESVDFSVKTPFEPEEIIQTRVLLEGVGVTGKEAVEQVATAAAALNRNIMDVGSAIISMETEPLRRMGIQLKKNGDEFIFEYRDKMNQAVSLTVNGFSQAQQELLKILETKYDGGLEKMSQTWQGKLSTMKGAWQQFMAAFGSGVMEPAKGILDDIIGMLNEGIDSGKVEALGKAFGEKIAEVKESLADAFKSAKEIAKGIGTLMQDDAKGLGTVLNKVMESAAEILFTAISETLKASLSLWKVVGLTIWQALEEQYLKSSLAGPEVRRSHVGSAVDDTSTNEIVSWGENNGLNISSEEVESARNSWAEMRKLVEKIVKLGPEAAASFAALDNASKSMAAMKEANDAWVEGLSKVRDRIIQEKQEVEQVVSDQVDGVKSKSDDAKAKIDDEGTKVFDSSGKVSAAYDAQGNKLGESSEAYIARIYDVNGNLEKAFDSAEDFETSSGDYAAAITDGNGKVTKALAVGAEEFTESATAAAKKVEEKAKEKTADLEGAAGTVTKAADDLTGAVGDGLTKNAQAINSLTEKTSNGIEDLGRTVVSKLSQVTSTISSIQTQLNSIQTAQLNTAVEQDIIKRQIASLG